MIQKDNLKKGDVVRCEGKVYTITSCGEEEVCLRRMKQTTGCYIALYEDLQPVTLEEVADAMGRIRGVLINRLRNEWFCVEYIGDSFVSKYLHSFQNQFKQKYSTDFPVHKLF